MVAMYAPELAGVSVMKNLWFGSVALIALAAAGPSVATDIPVRAPVYKAAPVIVAYNWTGFYGGLNAGYGWGDTSFNLTGDNGAGQSFVNFLSVTSGSFRTSGFIGGGQLGYNWQFNQTWLAGLEADIDYSNIRGSESFATTSLGPAPLRIDADRRLQWLGTLRGRLGVLPTDRLLIFATGGLAYGQNKASSSITSLHFNPVVSGAPDGTTLTCPVSNPNPCLAGTGSRTQ